MRLIAPVLIVTVLCAQLSGQEGNGYGNAYVKNTPALLGGNLTIEFGAPGLAFGQGLLSLSPGLGPTILPNLGFDLWLEVFHPALINLPFTLDAAGHGAISVGLANFPSLASADPWYLYAAIFDSSLPAGANGLTISKTVRVAFENPDSSQPVGAMVENRGFHTSSPMGSAPEDGDTSVLIAGGAIGSVLEPIALQSTEVFRPLFRSFEAGPMMATARAAHTATKLLNGHILIVGGLDAGDLATNSCEIFDPATETMVQVASMLAPRAGHAATLLSDGRVLVTGGLTTYTAATSNLVSNLATAQSTGEIYDPATGSWSSLAGTMTVKRMGHAQTRLSNGQVLISGGVTGGASITPSLFSTVTLYPVMTTQCEVFNPATGLFSPAPALNIARAFHSATAIPGRGILVAGGAAGSSSDANTYALNSCEYFAAGAFAWANTAPLGTTSAFHTAALNADGDAVLIVGGLTGTITTGAGTWQICEHDGVARTALRSLGLNPGIIGAIDWGTGAHAMTKLYDGTYLVSGGSGANATATKAMIYIPGL